MGTLHDNINFEERRDLVLLKALLCWVKARFATPLEMNFSKKQMEAISQLQMVDQGKKFGAISDEDAWLIERNALLFGVVGRSLLHDILPKSLFQGYGEVRFSSSRRGSVVDIAMLPIKLQEGVKEVIPCSMYITKSADLASKFKKNHSLHTEKYVDIVPLLKHFIPELLSKEEERGIEKYYHQYKFDPDVVKSRKAIEKRKDADDKNLRGVLRAIRSQGSKTDTVKLAVALHTFIKEEYKAAPHNVSRISFEKSGPTPVPDFSRLFVIGYDVDLDQVRSILEPILESNIKIKTGEGKVLFTTSSGLNPDDEDDMKNIPTAQIKNEKGLDSLIETQVGPLASIDDVNRIMDKYLQQRYQR